MKHRFYFVFVTLFLFASGCYEDTAYPDKGVCEPRLTTIDGTLDTLEGIAGDESTFHAFFEASYNELIKRSPEWVTQLGLAEEFGMDENLLDDLSAAYRLETYDLVDGILEILESYDEALLSPQDQITKSAYEWYLADWAAEREFMNHYYPLTQRSGPQFGIFGFFRYYHPVESLQNAEDYVSRLNDVGDKLACFRDNIEASRAGGHLPPKFMLQYNIDVLRTIVPGVEHELSMYTSFYNRLMPLTNVSDGDKQRLLDDALDAIRRSVIPGYRSLVGQLEDVIDEAPEEIGVGSMPGGQAFYERTLAHHTTTDMNAQEIHDLGLSEVARIKDEIEQYVVGELGYPSGLTMTEYYTDIAADGGYVPDTQVMSTYRQIIEDALASLSPAFDLTIETDLIVVGEDTAGYYVSAPVDGSGPGEFHAPYYGDMPWFPMPTLSYHEAVPGHHYQISIAQEIELPAFRVSGPTAYVEGWALYAERLAKELGWYDDDVYGDLGRLQDEMLRAVRLVVDTGMHSKGWTRDQATAYMAEQIGIDYAFSQGQVDRYAAWPAQSTAYKIGMIKILELRDSAETTLSSEFNLVDFHRPVLLAGSVPLSTLEMVVQNYVDGTYHRGNLVTTRVSPFDKFSPVRFAMPRKEPDRLP